MGASRFHFRAWDLRAKRWIQIHLRNVGDDRVVSRNGDDWYSDLEDVVVQFSTGLCDKNGKEIIEGDLLEFDDDFHPRYPHLYYEVAWKTENAGFDLKWIVDGKYFEDVFIESVTNGAVVGNIYENPELLQKSA